MIDTILAKGRWHASPDGLYRLERRGPDSLLHLITEKANSRSHYKWVTTQANLAKMYQVSVRTVRRWIDTLRKAGQLITEYVYDEQGHRCKTIFMIADFFRQPRGHQMSSQDHQTRSTSKPPRRASLSGDGQGQPPVPQDQISSPALSSSPLPPTQLPNQKTSGKKLDDRKVEVANSVDVRVSSRDNGNEHVDEEVSRDRTQKVLRWWIANRAVRPGNGEIAAMARSVALCLTKSSELRVRDDLFDLMLVGLDVPTHLESRTGFVRKRSTRLHRKFLAGKPRSSTLSLNAVKPSASLIPASKLSSETSSVDGPFSTRLDMTSDEDWRIGFAAPEPSRNTGTFDMSRLQLRFGSVR